MENIAKILILLKDVKDYQIMQKSELEYYQKYAPRLVDEPPAIPLCNLPPLPDLNSWWG